LTTKKIAALAAALLLTAAEVFAQVTDSHTVRITINPIAAMELNSILDVAFATTSPALAGASPGPTSGSPATDSTRRLWYTAANAGASTRHISVQSNVNAPAGTTLTVDTASPEGGTGAGPVTITTTAANLVTTLGSVATGRTAGDGALLTYRFWVNNPALLVVGAVPTVVTVTYTLTDDIY
jgi:hypothetical protein